MKKEEILKKAVEKVIRNGYGLPYIIDPEIELSIWKDKPYELIFSHDFAKAFFGTKEFGKKRIWINPHNMVSRIGIRKVKGHWKEETIKLKTWKDHLQQMVLCKDPISYLKKYL
jgi:hypothetical protein